MSDARLAPGIEISALVRRAEAAGGFGTVLRKGDPDRGSILLAVTERGEHRAFLERRLQADWSYRWGQVGPVASDSVAAAQHLAQVPSRDPDCWILELDVPLSERFIAETIGST